jgi:hypothetical protein
MVPGLLSILLRRVGFPENATATFVNQLIHRQRRIQTAYGLSDVMSIGLNEYMGGIGQGNPGGPTCYHLQLLALLKSIATLTTGYTITDPSASIEYTQHVASYVDDCNSLINILRSERNLPMSTQINRLILRTEHILQTWVHLIRDTGGEISFAKRFWTVCGHWDSTKGKLTPTPPQPTPEIMVNGAVYPMKPPSICERYLGVRVGISGEMKAEFEYRLAQSRQFATVMSSLHDREEAALAYRAYYIPKLCYPLQTTTFTEQELKAIESPSINAILTKLGYNRHFPRDVTFGPIAFGGLGLRPLYLTQGYRQLQGLVANLTKSTKITKLLQTLLRYTYLEAGTATIMNRRVRSYLTNTWLTSLLDFCIKNSIKVTMPDEAAALPKQRTEDKYIMQLFLNRVPNYSVSELRSLNRVRLSLQAYSLACITTQHKDSLRQSVRSQRMSLKFPKSIMSWPHVTATAHDWSVWKKAIQEVIHPLLPCQLGEWICTHQEWREDPPAPTIAQHLQARNDQWIAHVDGLNESKGNPTFMQQQVYGPPLLKYVRYKLGWTQAQIDEVNWRALQRTLESYPLHARTTRMKAMYGWLHTHQWKERLYMTSPTCPFCSEIESNDHVWICHGTQTLRQEALNNFIATIDEKTPDEIKVTLTRRLHQALALPYSDVPSQPYETEEVTTALNAQDELGWVNFIRGRHSVKWEAAYDLYHVTRRQNNMYKSGRKWATALVKASLTLLVDIWYDRTQQYHSRDDNEDTPSPKVRAIHQRVRETYADKHLYSRAVQAKLFDTTLNQRLQQRPFQLVKWLQTVDMTGKAWLGGSQPSIHAYYHPTRPPDTLEMTDDF